LLKLQSKYPKEDIRGIVEFLKLDGLKNNFVEKAKSGFLPYKILLQTSKVYLLMFSFSKITTIYLQRQSHGKFTRLDKRGVGRTLG